MATRSFDLTIDPTIAHQIADLAREYENEDFVPADSDEEDHADDPLEENDRPPEDVLEESAPDPFEAELAGLIEALDIDAQRDLLALIWTGRGDFDGRWADARRQARETKPLHILSYLEQTPLAGEYIAQALAEVGYPAEDYET